MSTFQLQSIAQDELIDLKLYQAGAQNCHPAHLYGPAIRNHFLFHYVLSGKGTLQSTNSKGEDRFYELSSGQGFLISPDQINTYIADYDDPWHYMWIEIDGTLAKRAFALAGLSFDSPIYTAKDNQARQQIATQMLQLTNHLDRSSFFLSGQLYLILDALIHTSQTQALDVQTKRTNVYVKDAKDYIAHHYHRPITVEEIATHCRLNRNYLSRIFKEEMRIGLQEYLVNFRLSVACDLLKFSDDSIRAISEKTGYNNQLYFSKAFKQKFSVSPTVWRNRNRIMPNQ